MASYTGYWDNQQQSLKILEKIELLKQVSVPCSSNEKYKGTDRDNGTASNDDYTDAEEYVLNDSFVNKEENAVAKELIDCPILALERLLYGFLFRVNSTNIREKDGLKYRLQHPFVQEMKTRSSVRRGSV